MSDVLCKTRLVTHKRTHELTDLLNNWANMPLFTECVDETQATKLITLSLWHTYLFGRFTFPSYVGHMCLALRSVPPADEILGPIIANTLAVGVGEMATTNIFRIPNDSPHAHYWDMRQAAVVAGVNYHGISSFERIERTHGLRVAIDSSRLWTLAMRDYASLLEQITLDPLTTFLITLVSEDTIQRGYQTIWMNLPLIDRFEDYRTFLSRHIELDRTVHGPSTVEWLNHFFETHRPSDTEIEQALQNTIAFVRARIASYD